ncbi:Lanthionine synthetase C-like protein [Niveomyces insectorum RCEF 264]|uniref:Lanthionine synthetase C-like protein n=1 Tax=Niveomyces insectorum RCEF 264 TaxID=1081102 RepID=A0A167P4R2_9HYPO|nr:Lanthionine synthetase C-like protein [Niveomyces insectorum RCEF 264]
MALNTFLVPTDGHRFFANDATALLRVDNPRACLIESVSRLVRDCPPALPWASPSSGSIYRGLFKGPTSIAYLFWILSTKHADLEIVGKQPLDWCKAYLALGQDAVPPLLDTGCGVSNEYLAFNALNACVYQDEGSAFRVLDAVRGLETDPSYCEWLKGRAGALYLLRVMRRYLPHVSAAIDPVVTSLIETVLAQQPWVWNSRQYLGTVHGEIGIVTQIVLSDASYAPQLENKLLALLQLQDAEGNWPVIEGRDVGLVQFCHGAPGFVVSLLVIRPSFPTLHEEIDAAIALGRKLIWERGLLTKEPNICHGIVGNALALDFREREHLLSLATPDRVKEGVASGVFEKDGDPFGMLWGEAGRAWVWLESWDGDQGRVVLYSDV